MFILDEMNKIQMTLPEYRLHFGISSEKTEITAANFEIILVISTNKYDYERALATGAQFTI